MRCYVLHLVVIVVFQNGYTETGSNRIPSPTIISPWISIEAENGEGSTKMFKHDLGELPALVEVQVRSSEEPNMDFVFNGMGSAQQDDDGENGRGGIIYVYNETTVMFFAPLDYDNTHSAGLTIFTGGNKWVGVNSQSSKRSEVRARIWSSSDFPKPDFVSDSLVVNIKNTFHEVSHGLEEYPSLVKVFGKIGSGLYKGWISDGLGNVMSNPTGEYSTYGGIAYGFDSQVVRAWKAGDNSTKGKFYFASEGWNGNLTAYGHIQIKAWKGLTNEIIMELSENHGIGVENENFEYTFRNPFSLDAIFVTVEVEAIDGENKNLRFYASGAVQDSHLSGDFGGLVFGYTHNSIRFWRPNNDSGGYLINMKSYCWGGTKPQQSNQAIVRIRIMRIGPGAGTRLFRRTDDVVSVNDHIARMMTSSKLECATSCAATHACTVFSLVNNTCFLYGNSSTLKVYEQADMPAWRLESYN